MVIGPVSPGYGPGFGSSVRAGASARRPAASSQPASQDLRDLAASLVAMRKALAGISASAGRRRRAVGSFSESVTAAVSATRLGLDLTASSTRLSSKGEILTTGSVADASPEFHGKSTSQPTIGGAYGGAANDTLTFEAKLMGGAVGKDNLQIDVRDGTGAKIDMIHLKKGDLPGTKYKLANGLEVSFSAGRIEKGDSFALEVQANGSADPDRTFATQGQGLPMFDPGLQVVPGAFEINGAVIKVASTDTLQSVLQRITQSAAGVEARYEADQIVLENKQDGAQDIRLGNDSSGFLKATKLADAQPVLGHGSDLDSPLATVAKFRGVKAGVLVVGGNKIQIDPAKDSLADVMRRIDGLPGVSAAYDPVNDMVSIAADEQGESFSLGHDSSGLLAALGLDEGTYGSEVEFDRKRRSSKLQVTHQRIFRDSLRDLGNSLDGLFDGRFGGAARGAVDTTLREIRAAVSDALEDVGQAAQGERLRTGLGLEFRFGQEGERGLIVDKQRLQRALEQDGEELGRLLFGTGGARGEVGLATRLDRALERTGATLASQLGPGGDVGLVVDLKA